MKDARVNMSVLRLPRAVLFCDGALLPEKLLIERPCRPLEFWRVTRGRLNDLLKG